jgi:pimeloyl-ACP methyl ester carboxylesterase
MIRLSLAVPLIVLTTACSSEDQTQTQGDTPGPPRCVSYYDETLANEAPNAAIWCQEGAVMTWQSTDWPSPVELFYHCEGEPSAPALYMQHGWPTSSFDFQELSAALSSDFFVCALDTPGYGFSDKPDGYPYSMLEDAEIVETFIETIMEVDEVLLLAHDKGDSVGLELLHRYVNGSASFELTGCVMLNGSIHLEQAELSPFQTALLDPVGGPSIAEELDGTSLAALLSESVYSPSLSAIEMADLASVFDFDDGTDRLHQTIQYLEERRIYEDERWLAALAESRVPTTLIWAELDPVAVPAVADYVWDEVLASRPAPADYWRVPCGNHYVQNDRPQEVLAIVRGEPVPTDEDSECAPAFLLRTNDGRP